MANEKAYRRGFMDKLAEFSKLAGRAEDEAYAAAGRKAYWAAEDKKNGVVEPEPYVRPEGFKQELAYSASRLGKKLHSTGRGLLAGLGNMLQRGAQGAIDFGLWLPLTADELINGKLLGIDEGRGAYGRLKGKMDRMFDSGVHGLRQWSEDYDYRNRINGRFNRFVAGKGADMAGAFAGWGGLRRGLLSKAFGVMGAMGAGGDDSREGQLRAREAMLRAMHPRDRIYIDPTSTAYNQQHAPTLAEYRRYHMPSMINMPASVSGYTYVPYNWRHQGNYKPVEFRDFGT